LPFSFFAASLTAQSYLTFLACISPHQCDLSETLSTLRFGTSAKKLRLNPMQVARQKVSHLYVIKVHTVEDHLAYTLFKCSLVARAQETNSMEIRSGPRLDALANCLKVGHILTLHRYNG